MEQGHYKLLQDACPLEEMRQHHPEFTHSSYLRLRSLEEVMFISNYLENLPQQQARIEKLSISQKIHDVFHKKLNLDQQITAYDRSYGIQKIFDLHMKKDYKPETLFVAAGILDRYLYMIGA
jgi:hypothetical protein